MVIGIDGNEANVKEAVGVSVYTQKLLSYFHDNAHDDLKFEVFLDEDPRRHMPERSTNFSYHAIGPSFLWSQIALPLNLLIKRGIDVFFSPAHYAPRFSLIPTVVTVHDLSYFYYPEEFLKKDLYKLENWTKYSVRKAEKVIAVSKSTKKDLMTYYEVPEKKIEVVYNGFEKLVPKKLQPTHYKLQPQKYILFVGTLQPRKNLLTLIKAYALFHRKHKDMKLVIVGKRGWMYHEIYKIVEKLHLTKDVVFTGYAPDETVVDLYKNAFCFVAPSYYEGFGIPTLEAMSFGTPVISSNTASLPEVGGPAALYFNPFEEKELLHHLETLLKDHDLRNKLIEKGYERVRHFSWEKCAQQTLEVLRKTAK